MIFSNNFFAEGLGSGSNTVLCFPISVLIHQTLSAANHRCDQKYLKVKNFYLTKKIGSLSLDQSLKQADEAQ